MSTAIATAKESTARPLAEIVADLSRPIEAADLKTKDVSNRKSGKTTQLIYIPWYRAIKYLDQYAPGWNYEIRAITPITGAVALTVRISIPCAEGIVYREATGIEDEETSSFGDPTSNAESMALRRAAAKFGLGLYLYDKGRAGRQQQRPAAPEPVRTVKLEGAQPQPSTPASPRQELRALNRKLGFTDAQLLKWLTNKYGLTEGLTLGVAMDSLQPGELSQAIDLFTQKVEEAKK